MATLTPTENSTGVKNQGADNAPASGSSGNQNRIIIPGQQFPPGSGIIPVSAISADSGTRNDPAGIKIRNGSEVEIDVVDLNRYDEVFLSWQGHAPYKIIYLHKRTGFVNGGYLSFKIPDEIVGAFGDNGHIFVRLRSKNQPRFSGTISYYLTFQKETEEEAKKRKAAEEAGGKENQGRAEGPGPTGLIMESMGDVLGGIATAGQSKPKISSDSKTASAGSEVSSAKEVTESSGGGGGSAEGDFDSEDFEQGTGGESLTSTQQISTGGQTIRESGTVSGGVESTVSGTAAQTRTIGTSGTVSGSQKAEVSSGGTVGQRISAEVSGQAGGGTATTNQTISQGGTVSSGVTGGGQATQETQVEATAATQVSGQGSAGVSGGVSAETETFGTGEQPGSPSSGAGVVSASAKTEDEIKGQASTKISETQKAEAKASSSAATDTPQASAPEGGENKAGEAKKEEPQTSQQPGQTAVGKGSVDGIDTVGKGLGGASFGGSTNAGTFGLKPPAGLGAMKSLDVLLTKNIAGNLPAASSASDKASDAGADKNKPVTAGQPSAKKSPTAPRGSPADEDRITPPLGGSREPSSESGPGQNKELGGRQIDSAGPPGGENPENAARPGGPKVGEPLQTPENKDENAGNGNQESNPEDQDQNRADDSAPKSEEPKPSEDDQDQQNAEPETPQQAPGAAPEGGAALGGGAANKAVDAAADSKVGQELLEKTSGQLWWYAFSVSAGTFFTGFDLLVGALGMDAYWIFGHRKQPKLFPMKRWQKLVTVFANVFPFILLTLGVSIILIAGCNWPVGKSTLVPTYKGTALGAFIGDSCKTFDLSNVMNGSGSVNSSSVPATQTGSQTTSGGTATPRGSLP